MLKPFHLFTRLVLVVSPMVGLGCGDDGAGAVDAQDVDAPQADAAIDAAPPAPGALDPAFGTNGVLTLGGSGYGAAIAAQGDKLIACTTNVEGAASTARIYRLDPTGAIDTTFGTEGRITIGDTGNVACRDVAVAPGGELIVGYYTAFDQDSHSQWYSADGASLPWSTVYGFASKLSVAGTDGVSAGYVDSSGVLNFSFGNQSVGASHGTFIKGDAIARATHTTNGAPDWMVARVNDSGTLTWQVIKSDNGYVTLGPAARASAGDVAPDLLADAIRLPDDSWFAVGSVDSDEEVMVARFVDGTSPKVDVEHHTQGNSAGARSVALDGMNRPIVVGVAREGTTAKFAWQRYLANSVILDTTYQTGGVATAAAPSGQAELLDVVRLGGALYAIGSYDVETTSPKVALVKLVE